MNGREALLGALATHVCANADERDACVRMQAFVSRHHDCFRRELEVGHVTGSAWILSRDARRVLLTHHRKLDLWLQLGGHADGDDDVRRVALREAGEESGLTTLRLLQPAIFDVDVHAIPQHGREVAHLHYDVRFLFQADETEVPVVSAESHGLSWVELERVADLTTDRSVLRMVGKSFALRR